MTARDCPYPAHCPVPDPVAAVLRRVRSTVWPTGTSAWRGHPRRFAGDELVPGVGASRFAPLANSHHSYLSRTRTAGLLESALHDATGPAPRIRPATLARWALSRVETTTEVRLADLRDPQLERLGIDRSELVATLPAHYPCTREWAQALHRHSVGGRAIHGLVWHSRQADLHARHGRSALLTDLLVHRSVEVAVVFAAPDSPSPLALTSGPQALDQGEGLALVRELAAILGVPIL